MSVAMQGRKADQENVEIGSLRVPAPDGSAASRMLALPGLLLLAAFAVWGSPFLPDYLNSGDQLPPMLQSVDPQLFPADPVVEAMGRLKSGFYLTLAAAMRALKLSPQHAETLLHGLFIVSKLLLIAAVFAVTRALQKSVWLFAVFAAWCCHQKPALLGSITLFMPVLTHNEIALVSGLFAVACLLRGRMFWFWLLAGATVLIHVLVGLQLLLCFGPVLLWRREFSKGFVAGAAVFAGCCLLYLLTMTPPALSADDWQLFVAANGHTAHISLFNHGWLDWLGFASIFGMTLLACHRFLKGDAGFDLLRQAAISGAALGLLLSLAAVAGKAMKPMLFQPMRVFFWVTLFCFLLLAAATVEAFKQQSRTAGILPASVLVLTVLNSILTPVFAFLALSYFVVDRLKPVPRSVIEFATKAALTIGVAGIFAAWALGARQPVGSLRSPVLLLPGLLALAVLRYGERKRPEPCLIADSSKPRSLTLPVPYRSRQTPAAALLIGYCLIAASLYRHDYAARWLDADWRAVRLWAQTNTQPADRFITPPDEIGFRVLSLRSTMTEALPRVIWAAPKVYLDNKQAAERAAKGYAGKTTDPAYLFELAREWRCEYVVARGSYDAQFTPVFRKGEFSILKVPK